MSGSSPDDLSWQLVDGLKGVFKPPPGHRAAHAKGICCTGAFIATPYVSRLTRAAHMAGRPVSVTVRFSNGSGNPTVSDDDPLVGGRGMAVKFHLPGGKTTDLLAIATPVFPARTPEDFIELARAMATGTVDAFKKAHPELQAALETAMTAVPTESYAEVAYWAIHAFRFANAQGQECFVRYFWRPRAVSATASRPKAEQRSPNYLQAELRDRLGRGAVGFTLHLQLAATGDDVNDPATAWPEDRPFVLAGALELSGPVSDQASCEALAFDPTQLTDGIACSADPILNARSGAYFLSHKRRAAAGTT